MNKIQQKLSKKRKSLADSAIEASQSPTIKAKQIKKPQPKCEDEIVENGNSDNNDASFIKFSPSDEEWEEIAKEPIAKKHKPNANIAKATAVKKVKPVEKVKPPSLEEINELRETRNLFHSNLFRLQITEMLTELQIKAKYKHYINEWLEQFKHMLHDLEDEPIKQEINNLFWFQQSMLQLPINLEQLKVQQPKCNFQFFKPTEEPFLIGAAASKCLLGPKIVADICVIMPAKCFQKDDYLNLCYDLKRAYYLTFIANSLLMSKQFGEQLDIAQLNFQYYGNNPLKPVLQFTPAASAVSVAERLTLRIFVVGAEQSFKLSRFVPWNSNLRESIFNDANLEEDVERAPIATANYNANVLFDLTLKRNQRVLQQTFENNVKFQEGLLLLKVWLRQRQLHVGYSGFNSHMLSMFMAYLFRQRKLHVHMSSYQVARSVWNHLVLSNWDQPQQGITLYPPKQEMAVNQPTLEQFHAYFSVVFIDVTGFHNICANLSLEMYRRVRLEAKTALDMLNDMRLNSFQALFMNKCPLYAQFDHIIKINKKDAVEQMLEMHVPLADKLNYVGYAYPQLLKLITALLQKGLQQRILSLLPIEQQHESWSVSEQPIAVGEHLHLGVILNPEQAFEVLDKGPESIADSAGEFRRFWGSRAELRRFQDGTIAESVVWAATSDTLAKKRLIVRSIVLHLLQHHFQLDECDVDYVAGEFDIVYRLTPAFKTDMLNSQYPLAADSDAESLAIKVIRCFDDLRQKMQALSELQLEIVNIAGISPVFRYCEPTPLLPNSRCINRQLFATHILCGIIQLGQSSKWPGELNAFRALKSAFYMKIAHLLQEQHKLHAKATHDGIIVIKQGYCFSLEIAHTKELMLLKQCQTERGITQYVDNAASIALEKRHYILPKVTGALHALYQKHASFGTTVMIAKRWLWSQLIDDGLWPDECTELLIASQYLKTQAQHMSCSPQTGFWRFLHLLAYTDWKTELTLINFNETLNENEISDLEHRFHSDRDAFPMLCIMTAYDQKHYGKLWSSDTRPYANVIARVTILARQALAIIEPALLGHTETFIKPSKIFTPSNNGYDLVIQLKSDMVTNTLATEFSSAFTVFSRPNWRLPLAGTNFVQAAVYKLREAYADFAAFFYNSCGGKEIAVVWKPNAFEARPFKVNDVMAASFNEETQQVQCKRETLIEDFKIILKDFYLRIGSVAEVFKASRESSQNKPERYFLNFKETYSYTTSKAPTTSTSTAAQSKNKYKYVRDAAKIEATPLKQLNQTANKTKSPSPTKVHKSPTAKSSKLSKSNACKALSPKSSKSPTKAAQTAKPLKKKNTNDL